MNEAKKITFLPIRTTLSGRDSTCGKIREWLVLEGGVQISRRYSLKDCKRDYPTGVKA
jgi:hypothetical protein